MRNISAAGNTVVPAILALENPVTVLGLVKLVEMRGWELRSTDPDVERVMRQYTLGE
jgi:hypothetical protein